jgi:hypothetical protein
MKHGKNLSLQFTQEWGEKKRRARLKQPTADLFARMQRP